VRSNFALKTRSATNSLNRDCTERLEQQSSGQVSRVPAPEIEQAIVSAVQTYLAEKKPEKEINHQQIRFDRTTPVSRIDVQSNQLVISVKPANGSTEPEVFSIPWQKPPSKRFHKILLPHGTLREKIRPERAERRARLVSAIARGRRWLDEIIAGSVSNAEQLAKRERCTVQTGPLNPTAVISYTAMLGFQAPAA
jgi:site-specific DNA recombinase